MEITKIVITGGPCAGKTTAMSWIQNHFTKLGYRVLFVPETATELISGGVAPWTCGTNAAYQGCQMKLQLEKEKIFEEGAATMPVDKILLVCDRGTLDNKAYMTEAEFAAVVSGLGCNEVQLRDSYDAVFHLVTAAKGAEQFYTTANNAARTETVEQVKNAVEAMRFPPVGHKGKGGYCQVRAGETLDDFNKNRHLLVQIESPTGIKALPDMLEAYGDEIAAIVIGPYDLSFTMNMPAEFNNPQFIAAVKEIFDICISRKKSVGIFCDSTEQARKYREMGANFMWMCTDDQIVRAGLRAVIAPLAGV